MAARERRLVGLAAALVGLALLWWLALAPALATLRQAEVQRPLLDAQWQRMQALQAEAAALKASPRMGQDEALRALEALVKQRLGATAQLSVVGDRANLTLKNTPAADLAGWLAEAPPAPGRSGAGGNRLGAAAPARPAGRRAVAPARAADAGGRGAAMTSLRSMTGAGAP